MNKSIFVFGSNLAGIHGAGAAKEAYEKHGAVSGRGIGLHGNSYGIPTKNSYMRSLPLSVVTRYVFDFIKFATEHPELEFKVTQIGCGHAGFEAKEIAPLFRDAPDNCSFDSAWYVFLGDDRNYWGTYPKPKSARTYKGGYE